MRFQIDATLGAKPQTVPQHGTAKQQHGALIWKWHEALVTIAKTEALGG
ncbi:MAG TPA: hypothetical protein PLB25_01345 [Rhodoferax sp.]|nr:hypothetical protein [Rhodoferax sp.]